MSPFEIISRLCDVTNALSDIVKKQQEIIEQSKIEESIIAPIRDEIKRTDRELDIVEYYSRRYADTDNAEIFSNFPQRKRQEVPQCED